MAVYFQGYNPWREQLAGSILAPLLKIAIERGQQADMNRKENAFIGEAMKQFQPPVDTSMPSMLQGFEGPQPANPWEASANDAGLMRGFDTDFGAQAMTPQPPSLQDIQRNLAELQASDRFNMLSPDRTRQLMAPMMEQYAAAENARKMQDFFAQFADKQDPVDQLFHMLAGAGLNYLPDRAAGDFVDLYKHQTPHQKFEQVNTGDRALGYTWNPATGSAREVFAHEIKMNPYQAAQIGVDYQNIGLRGAELAQRRREWLHNIQNPGWNTPSLYKPIYGPEGEIMNYDQRTGNIIPTPYKGGPTPGGAPARDYRLDDRYRRRQQLEEAAYGYPPSETAIAQLVALNREIEELEAQKYLGAPPAPQTAPSQPASGGRPLSQTEVEYLKMNGYPPNVLRKKGYIVP